MSGILEKELEDSGNLNRCNLEIFVLSKLVHDSHKKNNNLIQLGFYGESWGWGACKFIFFASRIVCVPDTICSRLLGV